MFNFDSRIYLIIYRFYLFIIFIYLFTFSFYVFIYAIWWLYLSILKWGFSAIEFPRKRHAPHVFWLRRFQGINNVTFDVTDSGSLLCTFLILTSDIRTALERVLRKSRSRWISLLKHRFSPVKTWLSIPRDTAFLCNNIHVLLNVC